MVTFIQLWVINSTYIKFFILICREDVENMYLCFCEVARPESSEKDAWIIQKFPDTYKDDHILKSVPKFTYPCEFEK